MNDLRSTFRRVDGQRIWNIDEQTYFSRVEKRMDMSSIVEYETGKPFDVIEEQWDGKTLVRFRTVRLGADEKCWECRGDIEIYKGQKKSPCEDCWNCDGTGIQPRDTDPEWTEVKTA